MNSLKTLTDFAKKCDTRCNFLPPESGDIFLIAGGIYSALCHILYTKDKKQYEKIENMYPKKIKDKKQFPSRRKTTTEIFFT